VYEENKNQRAPPLPKIDYTERVEIVPSDDGWPEYLEQYLENIKLLERTVGKGWVNENCWLVVRNLSES